MILYSIDTRIPINTKHKTGNVDLLLNYMYICEFLSSIVKKILFVYM